MTSGVIHCRDGDVTVSFDGAPLCSGIWTLVPVPEPFDISTADPEPFSVAFGVGFALIGAVWFAGRCARGLLSMIR